MNIVLIIVLVVVGLIGHSIWYNRMTMRRYLETVAQIKVDEIPNLLQESKVEFQSKEILNLNEDSPSEALEKLEAFIKGNTHKPHFPMFKKLSFMSWMVYAGVILGEIIKLETGAKWIQTDSGNAMKFGDGENSITLHPFEKVMKHDFEGKLGELKLYVQVLKENISKLEEVAEA